MAVPLLEIEGLVKHFSAPTTLLQRRAEPIRAVDGITFSIDEDSTFALVGESGVRQDHGSQNDPSAGKPYQWGNPVPWA